MLIYSQNARIFLAFACPLVFSRLWYCNGVIVRLKLCSQQTNWTELRANCSARIAALQPINFVTLTRVTNNASCNWVNLVQVSSVQFVCCAVNTAFSYRLFACVRRWSLVRGLLCIRWNHSHSGRSRRDFKKSALIIYATVGCLSGCWAVVIFRFIKICRCSFSVLVSTLVEPCTKPCREELLQNYLIEFVEISRDTLVQTLDRAWPATPQADEATTVIKYCWRPTFPIQPPCFCDCETFRIPSLMSKRTIGIPDDGRWRRTRELRLGRCNRV